MPTYRLQMRPRHHTSLHISRCNQALCGNIHERYMAFISVLVTSQGSMLPRDYRERPVAFGTTSRKFKLHRVANGPNLLMADCLMSSNCCASEVLKRCPASVIRWNASLYVSANQSALGLPGLLRDGVLGVIPSVFRVTCASGSEGRARRMWPSSLHFALRHVSEKCSKLHP